MRTDPSRTLELLDRLQDHGFEDSSFALLHHFPNHSIRSHSTYCQKQVEVGALFQDGGANSLVQHRLEIVHGAYQGGGFTDRSPELFVLLSKAALAEVPIRN